MVDTSKTSKDYELELYVTSAAKIQRLEARIKVLKHKLSPLSSATPSYVAGLEAECDKLRAELERFLSFFPDDLDEIDDDDKTGVRYITPDPLLRIRDIRKARAALAQVKGEK